MDEEGERRRNGKEGQVEDMGWGEKETFRTRLGRVELREGEVQEVLKEMSKRIREALERAEGEMEEGKKGIAGEMRIAKKRRDW